MSRIKTIRKKFALLVILLGLSFGFLVLPSKYNTAQAVCCGCATPMDIQMLQQWIDMNVIQKAIQQDVINQAIKQDVINDAIKQQVIKDALGVGKTQIDLDQDGRINNNDIRTGDNVKESIGRAVFDLKTFFLAGFFDKALWPALQAMTEQLTISILYNAQLIGMMMDAQTQVETQRLLQQLQAQAHKDYLPSDALCKFGTNTRSLAMSDHKSMINQVALAERLQNRQTQSANQMSAASTSEDIKARWDHFKRYYCDKSDMNESLKTHNICAVADPIRLNKDIDFTRTIDSELTLNVNFGIDTKAQGGNTRTNERNSEVRRGNRAYNTNAVLSDDEEDVLALANNLYASTLFDGFTDPEWQTMKTDCMVNNTAQLAACKKLLNFRSVIAKRSVAINSYNAITAMRAEGSGATDIFTSETLKDLGFTGDGKQDTQNIENYLGTNPSYHAQMEVLTKKLYQNPNFYVNLIDKPANVTRQQAAMQAFGLMQDRDIYNSLLRQEMLLSVMLEVELVRHQDEVLNQNR